MQVSCSAGAGTGVCECSSVRVCRRVGLGVTRVFECVSDPSVQAGGDWE